MIFLSLLETFLASLEAEISGKIIFPFVQNITGTNNNQDLPGDHWFSRWDGAGNHNIWSSFTTLYIKAKLFHDEKHDKTGQIFSQYGLVQVLQIEERSDFAITAVTRRNEY